MNAAPRFIHLAGAFMNAVLQSIPFSRSRDQFSRILMAHNYFHLFRTHDKDDAELSKDIVMGYQGPRLHIALSFCIHWGGSPVISFPDLAKLILFLKPSSTHQSFMAYGTYQLNVGNFSLDTKSDP